MNCKEAEKSIAKFIENSLNDKEMDEFIVHVQECPQCMEELSIQYLVAVGMSRLEEGGTFDLRGELEEKLSQAHTRILFRRNKNRFFFGAEIASIVAFALFAYLFLF